ncbi:CRISPR-associated helicase/endonuclease Cas3 [Betaproteobacteria bacterium]|nr:CRISPR-associated helicase/endonuclease Cas3 [Betaproteobacteria bacterium]GHU45696.1 CRISPR-associated helicase/endonuclease Cas3 [Betaproteobacteria bacterium]
MMAIAHPDQSLAEHLLAVACLAKGFGHKFGLGRAAELVGLLHDLGKYSEAFQRYIASALGLINPDADNYVDAGVLKGKIDHSTAGAQFVWQALSKQDAKQVVLGQWLALCLASHHSGVIDCLAPDGSDIFGKRMAKPEQKGHLEEVQGCSDEKILKLVTELLAAPELLNEFHDLIQRLSRFEKHARPLNQQFGLALRFLFSCLVDADRIDTARAEEKRKNKTDVRSLGKYESWDVLAERLERKLATFPDEHPIDHLRHQISDECLAAADRPCGVYTLTVPTGGGKTLASLRFALKHAKARKLDRIIYVIPFTSIIDQNAGEVRKILEPEAQKGEIVLEHHSNLTPEQQDWHEKILCENWDAPVVYTTMVQFLESLFGSGVRGARRMHQLANSVLIFDEIQTLPVRCVHLFNNAINFLSEQCNSTIVLCTATQPLLHNVDAKQGAIRLAGKHEIVSDVRQLFSSLKRVEIIDLRRSNGWSYREIANLAHEEVEKVRCCLVIVNTKDAAEQIFMAAWKSCINEDRLFHLSTDMCPAHRKEVLNKIKIRLKEDLPTLCVSTQLIEAGVDVDFGCVIRSMAGLDSIAQAAGRCNRNGRSTQGQVYLVNPTEEKVTLETLPDIAIGKNKAEAVLGLYQVVEKL